jgi:N utilization substance protein B
MQSIYAMHQNGSDNLEKEKISYSIDNIQDLYLTMISSLMKYVKELSFYKSSLNILQLRKNALNEKFIKTVFSNSCRKFFKYCFETSKIDAWSLHEDYISLLLNAIKAGSLLSMTMSKFDI